MDDDIENKIKKNSISTFEQIRIMFRYIFTLLISMLFSAAVMAQEVEMADGLRSEGKIYIVVAVLLIIFAGIVLYLINIDKKVSKLEKEISNK